MGTESERASFGDTATDRSEQTGKTPSLKTWLTPKVITSSMGDAEAAAGTQVDGTAVTHS